LISLYMLPWIRHWSLCSSSPIHFKFDQMPLQFLADFVGEDTSRAIRCMLYGINMLWNGLISTVLKYNEQLLFTIQQPVDLVFSIHFVCCLIIAFKPSTVVVKQRLFLSNGYLPENTLHISIIRRYHIIPHITHHNNPYRQLKKMDESSPHIK
jgi:hypothetical protein